MSNTTVLILTLKMMGEGEFQNAEFSTPCAAL
jgi:hypothetical protein